MATDLEAQQRCSSWIFGVEQALRSGQEPNNVPNNLGFYISKLPEYCRRPSAEFTPREWRFGLHNRDKLHTSGSEAIKLSIASALGLVGQKWKDFCKNVVSDHCLLDIKHCYGLREEETILTDEVIRYILALDALFLVVFMEWQFPEFEEHLVWTEANRKDVFILPCEGFPIWTIVWYDLCKIENQVPFSLIIHVVLCVTQGRVSTLGSYEDYMKKLIQIGAKRGVAVFMDVLGDPFKTPESLSSPSSTWKTHFLAIGYEMICGDEGLKRRCDLSSGGSYLHIPSASKLRSCGITIKGISGPLGLLSYKDGCLSLPKMRMFTPTLGLVRNIAWYEYTRVDHCMFHDYILLMGDLIQTSKDYEILVEFGVFSECGLTAATVHTLWRELGEYLMRLASSEEHNGMKKAIIKRCKLRRYKWWDEFRTQFCSRPWFVISVLTITLVSVATLIQTYVAIIGSNGMKPHFP